MRTAYDIEQRLRKEIAASLALGLLVVGSARAQGPEPSDHVSLYLSAETLYDSNIEHDPDPSNDGALVLAAGIALLDQSDWWNGQFEYEFARHRYRNSDRWDRDSHQARLTLDAELKDRWEVELVGEGALKGSAEDRELADMVFGSAGISFAPAATTSLHLTGAWRHRWYREPEDAESNSPYGEIELRQGLGRAWTVEVGPRWDIRLDDDPDNDFRRWTYGAKLIGRYGARRQVALEIRYRDKRYDERTVEDSEELRRDRHWIPSVSWRHQLFPRMELELGYRYETRRSNDPEKEFDAHQVSLATRARF